MKNLSHFKSSLAETAQRVRSYQGQSRLTMSGDNWAQLLLGMVDMILAIEHLKECVRYQQAQIDTLSRRASLLSGRIKALEPAKNKKLAKKKRATG